MKFQALPLFATLLSTLLLPSLAQNQFQVPVPWYIDNIQVANTRHGTSGYWQFSILDNPTPTPQGFNTTCYFHAYTYHFAIDGAPVNAPCADPNVTFGFFPTNYEDEEFVFNVTHVYECGLTTPCTDNGTWHFSWDDVMGQEDDVQNNFGQAGGFFRSEIAMYPTRAVVSSKCEFC